MFFLNNLFRLLESSKVLSGLHGDRPTSDADELQQSARREHQTYIAFRKVILVICMVPEYGIFNLEQYRSRQEKVVPVRFGTALALPLRLPSSYILSFGYHACHPCRRDNI